MLLDFNLAEDTKGRSAAERAAVGGTLPYMAPEQLRAYRDRAGNLDGRCDTYSLGVILFELLTGRHPFPNHKGQIREVIPQLLADREKPPPSVRGPTPRFPPLDDRPEVPGTEPSGPIPEGRGTSGRHRPPLEPPSSQVCPNPSTANVREVGPTAPAVDICRDRGNHRSFSVRYWRIGVYHEIVPRTCTLAPNSPTIGPSFATSSFF